VVASVRIEVSKTRPVGMELKDSAVSVQRWRAMMVGVRVVMVGGG
jgi:hypothetical protein